MANFFDRFTELCEREGTTPRRIAKDIGIKTSTLSMWKTKGVTPNTNTIIELAKYFDTTPEYLLGTSDISGIVSDRLLDETIDVLGQYALALRQQEAIKVLGGKKIERIVYALDKMNDEGQQKAVERVEELTEIPRYRTKTAPQSPPAPQEGTDTALPPDGAKGPQEGG